MWTTIKPYGESALLLEWSQEIKSSILVEISSVTTYLKSAGISGITDIVPAYASLTVFYRPEVISYVSLAEVIIQWPGINTTDQYGAGQLWEIPVSYCLEGHKDMAYFMLYTQLSRQEIIHRHTAVLYDVYFIGFLPGFLYLGGLDERLNIPRKAVPDYTIPAGAVAIGGKQTGVYPLDSPGGWYVIGHTEVKWFDFYKYPYCDIKAGDKLQFFSI